MNQLYVCIYLLFFGFSSRLGNHGTLRFLCCTVHSHQSPILHTVSLVYICQSQLLSSSPTPIVTSRYPFVCSLHLNYTLSNSIFTLFLCFYIYFIEILFTYHNSHHFKVLKYTCWLSKIYLLLYFGGQLVYDVVLVSGAELSGSVTHRQASILFWILFPYRLLQSIEQSSLCSTVCPC